MPPPVSGAGTSILLPTFPERENEYFIVPTTHSQFKTLADIMALIVEETDGGAVAALHAARRQAKRMGMTGGEIKNLLLASQNDDHSLQDVRLNAARDTARRLERRVAELELVVATRNHLLSDERERSAELLRRNRRIPRPLPRRQQRSGLILAGFAGLGLLVGSLIGFESTRWLQSLSPEPVAQLSMAPTRVMSRNWHLLFPAASYGG